MNAIQQAAKQLGVAVSLIEFAIKQEAKDHPLVAKRYPALILQLVKDELTIDPEAYAKDQEEADEVELNEEPEPTDIMPEAPPAGNPYTRAIEDQLAKATPGVMPLGAR